MQDGRCPSCQKHFRAVKDDRRLRMEIAAFARLPPVCAVCGKRADRFERLRFGRHQPEEGPSERVIVFGLLGLLATLLVMARPRPRETMVVALPLCPRCDAPEPLAVNYDHMSVTFAVHERLRSAPIDEVTKLEASARRSTFTSGQRLVLLLGVLIVTTSIVVATVFLVSCGY